MTDPAQLPPEYLNKLDALKKRYHQADQLVGQRKQAEALAAFHGCFQFAAHEHFPLLIEQFMDLWLRIAACHADLNRHDEALKIYLPLEQILNLWVGAVGRGQDLDTWMIENNSRVEWGNLLPDGVTFMIPRDYDPRTSLAAVHEAMGLAYENTNRPQEAVASYQNAIDGYTQTGNLNGVARTWKHRAVGFQRRGEWPALAEAGEEIRAAAQALDDLNSLIDAYAMLFLAAFNQRDLLQALEHLRRAIDLEKSGHPLLMRDQKTLADLAGTLKKMAAPKPAAKPLPPALTEPAAWPGLFDHVTAQVKQERGGPQLAFTLHTNRFDEAQHLLRAFRITATPYGVAQLRALPEPPDFEIPANAQLLLRFTLDDLAPFTPIATLSLPRGQAAQLAQANAAGRGFTLVLDGGGGGGLLGKTKSESWRYENYLLDWEGWEGISIFVRTKWGDSPEALESLLESLHNRLKRGPATGLHAELGALYRLQDEWDSAMYWHQQEVRFNVKADGAPGPGAGRALGGLGVIHKRRGEPDTARDYLNLALSLNFNYYEALLSSISLQDDLGSILQGLARLYRVRADDQVVGMLLNPLCEGKPLAAEEIAAVVREASREVDLTHPLPKTTLENPAATLNKLMSGFMASPPPLTHAPPAAPETAVEMESPSPLTPAPPAAPEPAAKVEARLLSLEDVARVLNQFAASHSHDVAALAATPIAIEEMMEYRKDKQGKLTVTNVPGAMLPLSAQPELVLRVTLRGEQCTVRLMQEIQLPGAPESGLKSVFSKRLPALAGPLLDALNALVTEGVLVNDGQQLRYRGAD